MSIRLPERIWAPILYLLIGTVALWPTLNGDAYMLPLDLLPAQSPWRSLVETPVAPRIGYAGDIVDALYPQLSFVYDEWRAGELPLWNPYILSGVPASTLLQNPVFFPLNLIWLVAPLPYGFALSALLRLILAGLLMHGWMRWEGRSPLAAGVAGVAFALATFHMAWLAWPHSNVVVMMPALFWVAHLLVRRPGFLSAGLTAAAVALTGLAGFPGLALGIAAFAGAFGAVCLWSEWSGIRRAVVTAAAAAGGAVLGLGLVAFQLLPLLEGFGLSSFAGRRAVDLDGVLGRYPFAWIASWANPDYFGPPWGDIRLGSVLYLEHAAYVGVPALLLALALIVGRRSSLGLIGWFWIAAFGLIAVVTYQNPFTGPIVQLGPLQAAFNHRLVLVAGLGMAFLAALAVDTLFRSPQKRDLLVLGGISGAILAGLIVVALNEPTFYVPCDVLSGHPVDRESLSFQAGQWLRTAVISLIVLALVGAALRRRQRWPGIVLLAVLVVDLMSFAVPLRLESPADLHYPSTEGVEQLVANTNGRIMPMDATFLFGGSTPYRIRSLGGHDIGYTAWYGDVMRTVNPAIEDTCRTGTILLFDRFDSLPLDPDWLAQLGVTQVVDSPTAPAPPDAVAVAIQRSGEKPGPVLREGDRLTQSVSLREEVDRVCVSPLGTRHADAVYSLDLLNGAGRSVAAADLDLLTLRDGNWICADFLPAGEPVEAFQLRGGKNARDLAFGLDTRDPDPSGSLKELPGSDLMYIVYRMPNSLPVAYSGPDLINYEVPGGARADILPLDRVETVSNTDRALAYLRSCARPCAVVALPIDSVADGFAEGESIEVEFVEDTANRVTLRARSATPALVVLRDAFYPGWVARIDGEEAPLQRANVAFRGVAMPSGDHIITFSFEPPLWRLGLWIAGLSLLGTVALFGASLVMAKRRTD